MTAPTKTELDRKVAGQTICSQFLETVEAHGTRVALRAKAGDEPDSWRTWTFDDQADQVARVAGGLTAFGVEPGDRVLLMLRNIPAFHFVDLGVKFCGATPVSVYNSSSPEQIAYLASHCEAKVAIFEDDGFLQRLLAVRDQVPDLRHIVVLERGEQTPTDVLGADSLFETDPLDLADGLANVTPDTLATIIYTSGTTGPSKGVMLSHYNVVWTTQGYMDLLDIEPVGFRTISYLPMAHIAERMASHYLAVVGGYDVTTCPDPTQVADYAREVRPQMLFGVPRVWEKIHAGAQAALAADPDAKARFDEAVAAAVPIVERRTMGTASDEDEATWASLDEAAFRNVRERTGLDALELAVSGAAPVPAEIISWYRAIGVPLSEVYGLSETTGPMTWEPYRVKAGSVGVAFPGVEVFLAEDGEICCRGGNVFQGYLNDPERTAEVLRSDGTFASGDIGSFDYEGYLSVVDRKKELLITAAGKNVSPANLEAAAKTVPLIGQVCAVGDKRPFVAALVVLDPEVAPAWAAEQDIPFDTLADLAAHPKVRAAVDAGLEEAMQPFNQTERIKKVAILGEEWLPNSEELTPTSKLRRRGILAKHADEIEALYL